MKLTNVMSGKSRISSISLAVGAAVLLVWSGSAVRAMEIDEIAGLDESELKSFLEARRQKMLSEINLPTNPSKQHVREYIRKISEAYREWKRPRWASAVNDPQHKLFAKIGREHLDLLLLNLGDEEVDYYCLKRIGNIVTDRDKAKVIEWLEYYRPLARVVRRQNWLSDAKPVLLKILAERQTYIPTLCIQAVIDLKDPATYADLKWYLVHGWNNDMTYRAMRRYLPEVDLKDTVPELWKKIKYSYKQRQFLPTIVPAALEHGIVDALGFIVDKLGEPLRGRYARESPRELVIRFTDARGSDEELRRWFPENKDKLMFDPKLKKFLVGHTDR